MVRKGRRTVALMFLIAFLLSGCDWFKRKDPPPADVIRVSLEEFVEAIHYAIDEAANAKNTPLWAENDLKHMKGTCDVLSSNTASDCSKMTGAAVLLCNSRAAKTPSAPAHQEVCGNYLSGKGAPQNCSDLGGDSLLANWCLAADKCNTSKEASESACSDAKALSAPTLKMAELRVAVDDQAAGGGKLSVVLFTIGGGKSIHASNVVALKLKPRPANPYNVAGVKDRAVGVRVPSTVAQQRGKELAALITSAFKATMLCPDANADASACANRPPLAGSDISITFSLAANSNREIGLKKEWLSVPAAVELGSSASRDHVNTLTITYGRDE